jgi:hypothetical protein
MAVEAERLWLFPLGRLSPQEAEQILCSLLPETASNVQVEKRVVIDENTTRHSLNFSQACKRSLVA